MGPYRVLKEVLQELRSCGPYVIAVVEIDPCLTQTCGNGKIQLRVEKSSQGTTTVQMARDGEYTLSWC